MNFGLFGGSWNIVPNDEIRCKLLKVCLTGFLSQNEHLC
jgi:hypothetical protein